MLNRSTVLMLAALLLGAAPALAQRTQEELSPPPPPGQAPRFQFMPSDPRALPDFGPPSPARLFFVPGAFTQQHGFVAGLGVMPLPLAGARGPDLFSWNPRIGFVPNSHLALTQQNRFFFLEDFGFLPTGQPLAIGGSRRGPHLFLGGFGHGHGGFGAPFFGYPYLPPLIPIYPPPPLPIPPGIAIPGITMPGAGPLPPPVAVARPTTTPGLVLPEEIFGVRPATEPPPPGALRQESARLRAEWLASLPPLPEPPAPPPPPEPDAQALERALDIMREQPLRPALVAEVGATAVLVAVDEDGRAVQRRYPHEDVFFFHQGRLRSAAAAPELLQQGVEVLVPGDGDS